MNSQPSQRDWLTTLAALIFLLLAFGFAGGCDKADAATPGFYGVMESGDPAVMTDPATWQEIAASGANAVRLEIVPDGAAKADAEIALAESVGVEVLAELGGGPIPEGAALTAWRNFVYEFASRHQNVRAWELWNEPNIWPQTTPAATAEYIATVSPVIRAVIPNAQIIAPGLYTGYEDATLFQRRVDRRLRQLGRPHAYDALSVHPYVLRSVTGRPAAERIAADTEDLIRTFKEADPGIPVYVSEIGWAVEDHSDPANPLLVSAREQARIVRVVLGTLYADRDALGIVSVFYYSIADVPYLGGWQYGCGLIGPEGRRPAFAAFHKLTQEV